MWFHSKLRQVLMHMPLPSNLTVQGRGKAGGSKMVGGMPKWKAQSEQLRAAMRANRMMAEAKAQGKDIRTLNFNTGPEPPDDR